MQKENEYIHESGFREYDVRWRLEKDITIPGFKKFGLALGTFYKKSNNNYPHVVVVGHDFRSYSLGVKNALILGLLASGCDVIDIGLCLSPIAYFAQHAIPHAHLAMVTASHNENGWTGVKMSIASPLTLLPDDISALKKILYELNNECFKEKIILGSYQEKDFLYHYKKSLVSYFPKLTLQGLKIVIGCGNGTAGAFAPKIFEELGAIVIPRHCDLDADFPHYNPNPENIVMLRDIGAHVVRHQADIGFAFDGDGDRCGVIDHTGQEIFSDKIGLLLARFLIKKYSYKIKEEMRNIVVDIKSTSLWSLDNILNDSSFNVLYWKTGHSHIKKKMRDIKAFASFEKSGHFFFDYPFGFGYDDGILSCILIAHMVKEKENKANITLRDMYQMLPNTFTSPTMSPFCPDNEKYAVVERFIHRIVEMKEQKLSILNMQIININLINGIRFTLDDGTWGLVRASSNKPSLVVVTESPINYAQTENIFNVIRMYLKDEPSVGVYDQTMNEMTK